MYNEKEEIRLLRNEYARNWRRKNPDKVKATNDKFYRKFKEKIKKGEHNEIS